MTADPNNIRTPLPPLTGDAKVDALHARVAFGLDNLNETITYAFPDAVADYNMAAYHAESQIDELHSFSAFTAQQQLAALTAMKTSTGTAANDGFSIEGFTTVTFALGSHSTANLRFGNSSELPSDLWAHGYYAFPDQIVAGDVWFNSDKAGYTNPLPGTQQWWIQHHEIGHVMGLDHGHETTHATSTIAAKLGIEFDNMEYTVMSYNGFSKPNGTRGPWGDVQTNSYAQTYMMLDIYTLQYYHGADYTVNSGNTVYSWNPNDGDTRVNGSIGIDAAGNRIFATIWDGGGFDTYDLSAYSTNVRLDLRPGGNSQFSVDQLAGLGGGVNAAGNIYNAYLFNNNTASLIEAGTTGSGNDNLDGNAINNVLTAGQGSDDLFGYEGNDTLYGNAGIDVLNGGVGNDTLYGGIGVSNNDTFLFWGGSIGNDVIMDWQDGLDVIRLAGTAISNFAQVQANATQVGANVVIDMPNNGDTITINNWTLAAMNAGDFLFA